MVPTTDIVHELHVASNTIFDVALSDRQRLLLDGIEEAASFRRLALLAGVHDPDPPGFMDDMPKLAAMAGDADAVEVLIAAGMSMLAGEIERLRRTVKQGIGRYDGRRIVIGQGRRREPLKRREPSGS